MADAEQHAPGRGDDASPVRRQLVEDRPVATRLPVQVVPGEVARVGVGRAGRGDQVAEHPLRLAEPPSADVLMGQGQRGDVAVLSLALQGRLGRLIGPVEPADRIPHGRE